MRNKFDTYSVSITDLDRKWYHIDAAGMTLGRLASKVANILRGKTKTMFQPNMDLGDFVILTNIDQIKVTGNKEIGKVYYSYSGFPGGIKSYTFGALLAKNPEKVIHHAVKGMLPKGRIGAPMLTRLKAYSGAEHPHQAQKPETIQI